MTDVSFLNQIGESKSQFTTNAKFASVMKTVLYAFGNKIVDDLQNNLIKSNASGALSESIHFTITEGEQQFKFQLSLLDYYKWVDKGRRAGKQPPQAEILKWLGYKRINPSDIYAKPVLKGGHKPKALSEISKMKSLAFLIARHIGKHGTKPTNFYSAVVNETTLEQLRMALAKALKRDILIQIAKSQEN